MTEKPLHVQVAEVLGFTKVQQHECKPSRRFPTAICSWPDGVWTGIPPEPYMKETDWQSLIPCYDTDWSATGPLIEKYGIVVGRFRPDFFGGAWYAVLPGRDSPNAIAEEHAATPLIAVCQLILELDAKGELARRITLTEWAEWPTPGVFTRKVGA